MRKVLVLAMVIGVVALFAQTPESSAAEVAEPSNALLGISQPDFNFGTAPAGYKMTYHYVLKSLGEDALKISQVRATCGCTAAAPEKDILEPGDSTTVRVTFNSRGYDTRNARKSIRITTNDRENSTKNLTFNVNCDTTKYVSLKPDPVAIELGEDDDVLTETKFMINNISGKDIELELVSYDYDNIEKVTFADNTVKAGKSTEVMIKMLDSVEGKTKSDASVTIQGKGEESTRFTLPVSVSNFQAIPRTTHQKHNQDRKEK